MQKSIIGKKLGMTQVFDEKGNVIPVTVIEAGPCTVVMKKTMENDGYEAVQLGLGDIKVQRLNKPLQGHFKKHDVGVKKTLREFKKVNFAGLNVGDVIKADAFEVGELVNVVGTSKGKGWAGTVKRWGFAKLKNTHGTATVVRHPGSIGACADPGKVYKGKKMSGQMGRERVTVKNLTVVKIDAENNLLAVKGAVPGPKGGIVMISSSDRA
ncbi:MAG TPA: 50S ribosomal protein L3 [Clostridiales bacterium]|nr:50S ribosomal protein L3 [Clostridiales bacterium]